VQTLNQLLTEIDGFQPTQGVVFMAATNRAALLDPALLRAGRFDRKITIPRPDAEARLAILQVHAKRHKLVPDVDLKQLAQDVPGLVGADLANLLNEAALSAVRENATAITEAHVQVRLLVQPAPEGAVRRTPKLRFRTQRAKPHAACRPRWTAC
jgi:cell division protease FtsH